MDLRNLTLLIVVFGATYAHINHDVGNDFTKIIKMISGLQQHVVSLENEIKVNREALTRQIQQERSDDNCCCTRPPTTYARDCQQLLEQGNNIDGIYTIYVGDTPVQVRCDMANGGWTMIQNRYDGSLDYNKDFAQYSEGFGDVRGEHWLGLNTVHQLTSSGNWTLHIKLESFDGWGRWAEYSDFRIGAGSDFTLYFDLNSYTGTADDVLYMNHGFKFSTSDMDQDGNDQLDCVGYYNGGGWWHDEQCTLAITTGMPYGYGEGRAIFWFGFRGYESLRIAVLKIRRS